MVKVYTREGDFYEVDENIISQLSPTLFDSIETSKHTIALDIYNEMMDAFFFWLRTRSFQTGSQVMETLTVPHLLADVVDNGDDDGLLGHSDNVEAAGKIWTYEQLLELYAFATDEERTACGEARRLREKVTSTDSGHREGDDSAHDHGVTESEERTEGHTQGSSSTFVNSLSTDTNREASHGAQGFIGSLNATRDLEFKGVAQLGDSRSTGQARPSMAPSTGLLRDFRTPSYVESDVAHSLAGFQTRHKEGEDRVSLKEQPSNHPAPLPTPPRDAADRSPEDDESGEESVAIVLTPSESNDSDEEGSEDGEEVATRVAMRVAMTMKMKMEMKKRTVQSSRRS